MGYFKELHIEGLEMAYKVFPTLEEVTESLRESDEREYDKLQYRVNKFIDSWFDLKEELQKGEAKMKKKKIEKMLENWAYNPNLSSWNDEFKMLTCDVNTYAKEYKKGNLFVYTKDEYIELLNDIEMFDKIDEIEALSDNTIIIDRSGCDPLFI